MSDFATATREAYRYESTRGYLTTEQLWQVPLRSRDGFNLGIVAKALARSAKDAAEENFVDDKRDPSAALAERKLSIVKAVIEYKKDEEEKATKRAQRAVERNKLLEVLAKKQDAAIEGQTEEQIKARLAELDEE